MISKEDLERERKNNANNKTIMQNDYEKLKAKRKEANIERRNERKSDVKEAKKYAKRTLGPHGFVSYNEDDTGVVSQPVGFRTASYDGDSGMDYELLKERQGMLKYEQKHKKRMVKENTRYVLGGHGLLSWAKKSDDKDILEKAFGLNDPITETGHVHPCPRCGFRRMNRSGPMNAVSRYASVYICPECGLDEATRGAFNRTLPFSEWSYIRYVTDGSKKNKK